MWKGHRQPPPQERLLLYVGVKLNAQGSFKFSITVPNSFLENADWIDVSPMLLLPRGTRVTGVLGLGVGAYSLRNPNQPADPSACCPVA